MKSRSVVFSFCVLAVLSITTICSAQEIPARLKPKKESGAMGERNQNENRPAEKSARGTAQAPATTKDKEYKDKIGPNGETIYVDDHSQYYWLDEKGRRVYVTEADLKNK